MSGEGPEPIPVPFLQRLGDVRLRVVPVLVFAASIAWLGFLWNAHLAPASIVGQAEANIADLSSDKAGVLTELRVQRFQTVKANEIIGLIEPSELNSTPVVLKAGIGGIVKEIFSRPGETVAAGQPVVSIASADPVRIVGYLPAPAQKDLKVGMDVEVRTRGMRPEVGKAKVLEVGTQLESLPSNMLGPLKLVNARQALPIDISVPPNLNLRTGELVELILRHQD